MTKTLRLGVDLFYAPPLSWIENGKLCGVAGQMIESLGRDLGMTISCHPMEQSDLGRALDEDRLDLRFPDNPEWDYCTEQGSFSDETITYADAFFLKKDVGLPEKPCLGTLTEYPLPEDPAVDQIKDNVRGYNTIEELMTALWAQDVHILFGPIHAFRHALEYSPHLPKMEQVDWLPIVTDKYHFAFGPGAGGIRDAVNLWIARHRDALDGWNGEEGLDI